MSRSLQPTSWVPRQSSRIDRNGAGLGVARARAKAAGFSHVTFREGNLTDIGLDEKFDAVVGRLVLMYRPDPAATLRRLASHLKSGGIVAFGEYNITPDAMRAPADMPLTGKLFGWIDGAFRYAGAETWMADRLFRTYRDAGLANPKLSLMSYIGGGQEWDGYADAAATVRSLMPLILKAGLASADEIGIDTLEERLRTGSGGREWRDQAAGIDKRLGISALKATTRAIQAHRTSKSPKAPTNKAGANFWFWVGR